MSAKIYILILLSFVLALNCTPSKNIRQRNSERIRNNSTDDSFFKWPALKNEKNYEDLADAEGDPDSYGNLRGGKTIIESNRSGISDAHTRYCNREKGAVKRENTYLKKKQNINFNKSSDKKSAILENGTLKSGTYKAVKGDNLSKISRKFNVSLDEMIKINNLSKNHRIKEGMILKVPYSTPGDKRRFEFASRQKKLTKPDFLWPVKNVYRTRTDGSDGVKPIGIIITGDMNSAVFPAAEGIVTKIGNMRGFGNYVILQHINQYLSIYSNLKDINVNEGEKVKCGKCIGRLDGNKLHFQIDHSGKPQNPLVYLTKKNNANI